MCWQAHDLLWLDRSLLKAKDERQGLPDWVLEANGPVVVRRERVLAPKLIAVGVRGNNKSQRCAAYAFVSSVKACLTPYDIAKAQNWLKHSQRFDMPVLQALQKVAPLLDDTALAWGITGSLGYELATGEPQIHLDSDLDLVIRSDDPLSRRWARDVWQSFAGLPCRLDVQIETPAGAIALQEWASTSQSVLLKSDIGPFLVKEPWQQKETV